MRGRKPTPTHIRLMHNNPGKRPMNDDEPQPEALAEDCPDELSDVVAREEWERTIAPAIRTGQITEADRSFAIAHCELWATWRSQLEDAVKHPHVVAVGKNKYPAPNPARLMANKTLLLLVKVDAELGLSPSSRSRVKTTKKPGTSKLDKFRRGA